MTPSERPETLRQFYRKIQPGGPGWRGVVQQARTDGEPVEEGKKWTVPSGILAMLLGCLLVYCTMFATGNWIYGNYSLASVLTVVVVLSGWYLSKIWNQIKGDIL
jgi:hypothetical protein